MAECNCDRCGRRCQVAGARNPDAEMLRASAAPKGLCVDCAATEWLINTYPLNLHFDENGPEHLRHPQIQEQFAEMMRVAKADARPDEIDWERVIANWDLPVQVVKGNPRNPYTPTHPKRAARREYRPPNPGIKTIGEMGPITSIEEMNAISPGLGDEFRAAVRGLRPEAKDSRPPTPPKPKPPKQGELFGPPPEGGGS
jgi:hypothetical protein